MSGGLPGGIVTFVFTDVEGSTALLHELGAAGYADALAQHRAVVREEAALRGGVEVDTQGDAFFLAFADAAAALEAAAAIRDRLAAAGRIRVRTGIHTGMPHLADEGYVGEDVHLGARIGACGHGGQVVVSAATADAAGAAGLVPLGEHRLKDFPGPIALYQLGDGAFPPLRTISNTNLPRPASSFVGRERDVAAVVSLLRGEARLVSLTGPGGSGKTRLALEAAAELVPETRGGVFWIPLATIRDPSLVPDEVAEALGAHGDLAGHIGERELLLLLDNLEQVVEAAPELGRLLEACPNLRLLVTSRELLRIRGEIEYPVPPLADADAVALFEARARMPADDDVRELCRRLDNLPLAVELAAARATALSPAGILERLSQRLDLLRGGRDADPRQQTLRATIEWSHDLLGDEERRLFRRLSVFRGGCTLTAAEAVADAELDGLQALVEKSLVRRTGERYWLLETIRELARERLAASDEAHDVLLRYAHHYGAFARDALSRLLQDPAVEGERLEAEHDNLRGALDALAAAGEVRPALELAGGLARFWYMRGHLREGRARLEDLLLRDATPSAERAAALTGAATMLNVTGDPAAASERAREALALHERFGSERGAADARFLLGVCAADLFDYETGRRLMTESIERFRRLGDEHYVRIAGANLGYCLQELGELDEARVVLAGVAAAAEEAADDRSAASALGQLATVARMQGVHEEALRLLARTLRIWWSLGDRTMTSRDLRRLARVLAETGRARDAARVLASCEVLRDEAGAVESWYALADGEIRELLEATLDADALAAARADGRTLSVDEAVQLAVGAAEAERPRP